MSLPNEGRLGGRWRARRRCQSRRLRGRGGRTSSRRRHRPSRAVKRRLQGQEGAGSERREGRDRALSASSSSSGGSGTPCRPAKEVEVVGRLSGESNPRASSLAGGRAPALAMIQARRVDRKISSMHHLHIWEDLSGRAEQARGVRGSKGGLRPSFRCSARPPRRCPHPQGAAVATAHRCRKRPAMCNWFGRNPVRMVSVRRGKTETLD